MWMGATFVATFGLVLAAAITVRHRRQPVPSGVWLLPLVVTSAAGFLPAAFALFSVSAVGAPDQIIADVLPRQLEALRLMQQGLLATAIVGAIVPWLIPRPEDKTTFPKKSTAITSAIVIVGGGIAAATLWSAQITWMFVVIGVSIPLFLAIHVGSTRLLTPDSSRADILAGATVGWVAMASWIAFVSLFSIHEIWEIRQLALTEPQAIPRKEYWDHTLSAVLPFLIAGAGTITVFRFTLGAGRHTLQDSERGKFLLTILGIVFALALPPILTRTAYKPISNDVTSAFEHFEAQDK